MSSTQLGMDFGPWLDGFKKNLWRIVIGWFLTQVFRQGARRLSDWWRHLEDEFLKSSMQFGVFIVKLEYGELVATPPKNFNENIMNPSATLTKRCSRFKIFYPLTLICAAKNSKFNRFPPSSALKCAVMASSWRCKTATATSWLRIQRQRWRSGWPRWNRLYRAAPRPARTGGTAQRRWIAAWVSHAWGQSSCVSDDNMFLWFF